MNSLFIGHGSPENSFGSNKTTKFWESIDNALPTFDLVVFISSHWITGETMVFSNDLISIKHDFIGFPDEYYHFNEQYIGNHKYALNLSMQLDIQFINDYKIDHGVWMLLRHFNSLKKVPMLQLSINMNLSLKESYNLGKKLKNILPSKTLIIGSGNVVHNLSRMSFDVDKSFCWANKFENEVEKSIINYDIEKLASLPFERENGGLLSVPTIDHYIPLMYIMGTIDFNNTNILNKEIQNGSISMLSFGDIILEET